jgi:hypothetical protein
MELGTTVGSATALESQAMTYSVDSVRIARSSYSCHSLARMYKCCVSEGIGSRPRGGWRVDSGRAPACARCSIRWPVHRHHDPWRAISALTWLRRR